MFVSGFSKDRYHYFPFFAGNGRRLFLLFQRLVGRLEVNGKVEVRGRVRYLFGRLTATRLPFQDRYGGGVRCLLRVPDSSFGAVVREIGSYGVGVLLHRPRVVLCGLRMFLFVSYQWVRSECALVGEANEAGGRFARRVAL